MKLKIIYVIISIFLALIVFYEFADRKIGNYTITKSASQIPVFNYVLSGYDKNNYYMAEDFVNNYTVDDGYLYYTYISGGSGASGWCYLDDRLILSRINLKENIIEKDIDTIKYEHMYKKISQIHDRDKKWLTELNNKCIK